jgi:hypothetical protein
MSSLIHYRHNYVNPTIIKYVKENRKFFESIAELFKRTEYLEEKSYDLDNVYLRDFEQYDPMKHIRGSNLIDRSKLYSSDIGFRTGFDKPLFPNIEQENRLNTMNSVDHPRLTEGQIFVKEIREVPDKLQEVQEHVMTFQNQNNKGVPNNFIEPSESINQLNTVERINLNEEPKIFIPSVQNIPEHEIYNEIEILNESDIPYSFRKSQLQEYEYEDDKRFLIEIPRESIEGEKQVKEFLNTVSDKKETDEKLIDLGQLKKSKSNIYHVIRNKNNFTNLEDKENINYQNLQRKKTIYDSPKSNPNPPLYHHVGDKGEKKRRESTSKKRFIH